MRVQSVFRTWALRGVGIGAAAATAFLISSAATQLAASNPTSPATTTVTAPPLSSGPAPTSYADAVSRATPAVVTVQVEKHMDATRTEAFPEDNPFLQRFFGGEQPSNRRNRPTPMEHGLGSGVIVSGNGNILTNNHVVEGAEGVHVTLNDGREFSAKVVGTDPATDLAVIHIDATGLPVMPLADSDRVRVGDVVLAVGNPLGVGQTVTMGIISAKGRTTDVGGGNYEDFLQTDAPINQGNSGGALITTTGQLVGINSQIMTPSGGSVGIGFAIPSNMAHNVMTQLITSGHVRRAMLGVAVQAVTSDLAKSLGLGAVRGAMVDSVTAGGPAAKAGVKQGDVILTIDGNNVDSSNTLRNGVSAMAPGSTVTLGIERNGREQQVKVTLSELADASPSDAGKPAATADALGLTVQPLTPSIAQRLQLPEATTGVAVTNVDPSGTAARAGIQTGDVVREVNGQPIHTEQDLRSALVHRTDRPALAFVQRGDHGFYVALP